jgi:adenylate kinase
MDAVPTATSAWTWQIAPAPLVRGGPMRVVLMGPPGAGKGTQAKTVADMVGVAHVASGDLFRESVKSGDELGRRFKEYMDRGVLVPDDLTVQVVMERLARDDSRAGFILDGFPRSLGQAEALDDVLSVDGRAIDLVINLIVPDETLLARLAGRWLCRACHTSYHTLYSPPLVEGVCDRCGGELYQRVDDREDTARRRLEIYREETTPVLDYYRDRGILREVLGDRPRDEVTRTLTEAIRQRTA